MIELKLANPRGFCAGVKRAIDIVEKSINKYGSPVYVRHEIVHNKQVVEELKNNVSWTERSELQRLVVIVLVFSVLFSLTIWGADTLLSKVIQFYFNLIG